MKIKLIIFFIILLIGVGYGVLDHYATPGGAQRVQTQEPFSMIGKTAPEVSFTDLNGNVHALHDLKGKTVLLNFWATWCPPCVAEFPDLLSLADQYPDDFVLITLSSDQNKEDISTFFERFSEDIQENLALDNVIIAHDPGQTITRETFKTHRYPESILIAPDLTVIRKITGVVDIQDKTFHKAIKTPKNQ